MYVIVEEKTDQTLQKIYYKQSKVSLDTERRKTFTRIKEAEGYQIQHRKVELSSLAT